MKRHKEGKTKPRSMWIAVVAAATLVLMAGGAGALAGPAAPEATVAGKINYQGRLTDPGGTPLTGTFPMRFQVYNDPAVGLPLWDSGVLNVDVDQGLFNVGLTVDPSDFSGQGLWLRIGVEGEWLIPRQELLPVPYALSLRPGAIIQGNPTAWEGHVLRVNMEGAYPLGKAIWGSVATGEAVRGDATGGFGLRGYTEEGYAVYGSDAGSETGRGYGGYFTSNTGVAVYGHSGAQSYAGNMYAPGVYGRSDNGAGVYGASDGTGWPSYGGVFEGREGLYARGTGPSSDSYAGRFVSENYRGIYVISQDGYYDGYFAGTLGIYAAHYYSLQADRTVVVNDSGEMLEPGDVVAIAGTVTPRQGGEPFLAVRRADTAHSQAVVGVVVQAMRVETKKLEGMDGIEFLDVQPVEGNVPPGGYLVIVTHGLVATVKAADANLQIGDLLTISATPGAVCKAAPGLESSSAILGKVAGPVDTKTGTVPVFVVLR